MIDCGEDTEASWSALAHGLDSEGLTIKDIEQVIITHAHVDHMGMARRVIDHCDAQIFVNHYAYEWAVNVESMWDERSRLMVETAGRYLGTDSGKNVMGGLLAFPMSLPDIWKGIPESRVETYEADGHILIGKDEWRAIYVPGHSSSKSCFYNEGTKELLSADMLLSITPTPVIEFSHGQVDAVREKGILRLLESYKKLLDLDISIVYPGHYMPFDKAHEVIHRQVQRIHKRKEDCYQAILNGCTTAMNLFEHIYAGRLHLPAFNMLIGYLDLLVDENRIRLVENVGGMDLEVI